MGRNITTAAWFGLISMSLCLVDPAAAQVDQQRAEAYFKEADAICQRDGGRLWGISLCGPMVIADARTRTLATSQARPIGEEPRSIGFAKAPIEWGGAPWAAYIWDFITPLSPRARGELMMHELFHRIQPDLGLITPGAQNRHLDTVEGRVWLRLEWPALARALSPSGEDRKRAVSDAAAFRLTRRAGFPNAAETERVEEIREGLAQYTATVVTAASPAEAVGTALEQLAATEKQETFVQTFAPTSGVLYGILLDVSSADWRRRVRADSDLGQMLMAALDADAAPNAVEASTRYGGAERRAAEQRRDDQRSFLVLELRRRFVDGPVFLVPSGGGGTFDARGATPIPGIGTVYFSRYSLKGEWGAWRRPTAS
ncbi:MAG: hypothetical protein DMG25_04335 [Acidobacteria bacterium]|nr:MAG: hypothetical protein DMG25_04335 [Acidobacteriota bacterium]